MSEYKWSRALLYSDLKEILELVDPNVWDSAGLATKYPTRYRAYVAKKDDGRVDAIGIAAYLPDTKTMHVEDFALHPRIRGQGLARRLYNGWREYMLEEWPETKACGGSTTIEVYLQNVEAWRKIMQVKEVEVKAEALILRHPIRVMACNLTHPSEEVYAEWQAFQRQWGLSNAKELATSAFDGQVEKKEFPKIGELHYGSLAHLTAAQAAAMCDIFNHPSVRGDWTEASEIVTRGAFVTLDRKLSFKTVPITVTFSFPLHE